jgi:tRNA-dihydrouridine synthase
VIVSGGLSDEGAVIRGFEESGAAAVMLARGSFGNPWRFERLLGLRDAEPTRSEVCEELLWVIDRGEEHLGVERAGRYLRKFYPWYADTMGLTKRERNPLVTAPTTDDARRAIRGIATLADSSGPVP